MDLVNCVNPLNNIQLINHSINHSNNEKVLSLLYFYMALQYNKLGLLTNALEYFNMITVFENQPFFDKMSIHQTKLVLLNNIAFHSEYNNDYIFNQHVMINDLIKKRETGTEKIEKREKREKIRLGYVSSDFRCHVVSKYIVNILKFHDRNIFDIFCLYNNKKEDVMTDIIKKIEGVDNFINIYNSDNNNFDTEFDILIDLNGHTNGNRLDLFKNRTAPIQITYLGYPNTTGVYEIDYRLTDRIADNLESNQKYTEKLIYLNRCFLNYSPMIDVPIKKENDLVIGLINKTNKNSPKFLKLIKRLLDEIKKADVIVKLLIKLNNKDAIDYYNKMFEESVEIIYLTDIMSEIDYFDTFNKISILLDTFPYSGTTTTCDSLYMGTPVVTLYNKDFHAQNVSSSIITNCFEQDLSSRLITYSEEDYISKVIDLCKDTSMRHFFETESRRLFLKSMEIDPFIKEYESVLKELIHN